MKDLKERTKQFALDLLSAVQLIPLNQTTQILTKQLIRAGTSVGANYRSALRARSKPEFISKLTISLEEADECCYWLELISAAMKTKNPSFENLMNEAKELTAILTSSVKSAKGKS